MFISVAIYDTLGGEPVCLVDENLECLTERFIKVLTKKQEAIVAVSPSNTNSFQISKCIKVRWKK